MISFLLKLRRFVQAVRGAWVEPTFRATLPLAFAILLSGTLFYRGVEGWGTLDALYFSVMTLTTVGQQELRLTSDFAKVFTMLYAIVGIGIIVALAGQLAEVLLRQGRERREKAPPENTPRKERQ